MKYMTGITYGCDHGHAAPSGARAETLPSVTVSYMLPTVQETNIGNPVHAARVGASPAAEN